MALGCSGPTRVRLVLRIEDERFRPDHVDVQWGAPDGPQRTARIPATGSLPPSGPEIGSALITLDDGKPGMRRFVVRGFRPDGARISGASTLLGWKGQSESTVTLTLVDCYDDPANPPLPGCPSGGGPGDGGAGPLPDAGTDAPSDARDAGDAASDRPRG
jgi:hypothetical protein